MEHPLQLRKQFSKGRIILDNLASCWGLIYPTEFDSVEVTKQVTCGNKDIPKNLLYFPERVVCLSAFSIVFDPLLRGRTPRCESLTERLVKVLYRLALPDLLYRLAC